MCMALENMQYVFIMLLAWKIIIRFFCRALGLWKKNWKELRRQWMRVYQSTMLAFHKCIVHMEKLRRQWLQAYQSTMLPFRKCVWKNKAGGECERSKSPCCLSASAYGKTTQAVNASVTEHHATFPKMRVEKQGRQWNTTPHIKQGKGATSVPGSVKI